MKNGILSQLDGVGHPLCSKTSVWVASSWSGPWVHTAFSATSSPLADVSAVCLFSANIFFRLEYEEKIYCILGQRIVVQLLGGPSYLLHQLSQ